MYLMVYYRGGESKMDWSFIDRWPTHPLLVKTFAENIKIELEKFDEKKRKEVVILFSAHSVPQYVSWGRPLMTSSVEY